MAKRQKKEAEKSVRYCGNARVQIAGGALIRNGMPVSSEDVPPSMFEYLSSRQDFELVIDVPAAPEVVEEKTPTEEEG